MTVLCNIILYAQTLYSVANGLHMYCLKTTFYAYGNIDHFSLSHSICLVLGIETEQHTHICYLILEESVCVWCWSWMPFGVLMVDAAV